jgi:hypothetical protein
VNEFAGMGVAKSGGAALLDPVTRALDDYIAMLERSRNEQIPLLVQTIYAVNTFPYNRNRLPNQESNHQQPQVTGTEPKWGR